MERMVEICAALNDDPEDPFLQEYMDMCSNDVRLPEISDFVQIGSSCIPGMLCPSFITVSTAEHCGMDGTTMLLMCIIFVS